MTHHMIDLIVPIVEDEVRSGRKAPIEAIVETLEYVIGVVIAWNAATAAGTGRGHDMDRIASESREFMEFLVRERFPLVLRDMRCGRRSPGTPRARRLSSDSRH